LGFLREGQTKSPKLSLRAFVVW